MPKTDSWDRVRYFLDRMQNWSLETIQRKVREIEPDIYALFKRLERLHSISSVYQQIDLSEDIYTLCRMLEHKKIVKKYPLLSRAAGLL